MNFALQVFNSCLCSYFSQMFSSFPPLFLILLSVFNCFLHALLYYTYIFYFLATRKFQTDSDLILMMQAHLLLISLFFFPNMVMCEIFYYWIICAFTSSLQVFDEIFLSLAILPFYYQTVINNEKEMTSIVMKLIKYTQQSFVLYFRQSII